ncbi:Phox/Bem1p [Salix suchowensis]|nr:Phox/Bem1p [Salix suchowensis]
MVMSDSKTNTKTETLKFLCSYSGKLLPRFGDGVLRYVGGLTRVLAVDRSISYAARRVCGFSVELRCPLPNGDLETLISVKSEEELTNLIAEYDRSCPGSKIRAILFPPKSLKKISPPTSNASSIDFSPTISVLNHYRSGSFSPPIGYRGRRYSPSRPQNYYVIIDSVVVIGISA